MKTIAELESDIVNITQQIHTDFPELSKYIGEIPISFESKDSNQISAKNLQDYYNSLAEIMSKYAKTHQVKSETNEPKELNLVGYPLYPPSDDIYVRGKKETELDPEDTTKNKEPNEALASLNEKYFDADMSGDDLDVPGAELDNPQESLGSEDEENNYYSLGGDNHDN